MRGRGGEQFCDVAFFNVDREIRRERVSETERVEESEMERECVKKVRGRKIL